MSNVTTPSHYPTAEPTSHRPTNTKIPTHMPSFKPSKAPSPMPTGCIDVSASQLTGLEDLYNSSRGESWQWTADQVAWNFSQSSPNPCRENWAYITCSSCSITELSIESNIGMRGTIPPTISYLTHLKSLSIMNNDHLTGFIPTTIGKHIAYLNLLYDNIYFFGRIVVESNLFRFFWKHSFGSNTRFNWKYIRTSRALFVF